MLGVFNILGIIITLILLIVLLWALQVHIRFLKNISFKVRIILKNSFEKGEGLESLMHPLKPQTEMYSTLEVILQKEVVWSKNHYFLNSFYLLLEWYNHIFYVLLCWNKTWDKLNFLRYPTSFYHLTYLQAFTFEWLVSCLVSAVWASRFNFMTSYIAVAICGGCIGFIGCFAGFVLIFIAIWAKDNMIRNIFKREIYDVNHEVEQWTLKQASYEGGENEFFGLDAWVKQLREKKVSKIRRAIGE